MKRFKGLSLIETIVTLSVLAVVTAVSVPVYTKQLANARAEKLEQDIFQLVDVAASYSLRRWKPTYIHLVNIPSDKPTTDSSWCLVVSSYASITKCSDEDDTPAEKANEKRVATVFGSKHTQISLKRLTSQTKFKFDNNSYSLFLGDERKFDISFLEAQAGSNTFTAKAINFKDFELEKVTVVTDDT
ncbi:hypothetical protein A1OO_08675 [Enterovibrio norvegicus FF-33]|uniref:pilus assembly FimT family protein n=1 Tax=Enterovibrio norvegicus TaxID=188144 RepID=UPI0002D8647D|nr:type II secretion system protein [Enterovibrio norvegicus]OEE65873.1 hypothetical protein A1OO_08675 [Enterovibrio norvegicus FF-33]